ncbi:MAG: DUF5348 domain-containing protein [Treponema sp.]|nr:DUF5348 domain-containing protein [Treponema sp.]
MSDNGYLEGLLKFSEITGSFYIGIEDSDSAEPIDFGDEFEVHLNGEWIKTGLRIDSDENGLVFRLKNTDYQGILDDIPARKKFK